MSRCLLSRRNIWPSEGSGKYAPVPLAALACDLCSGALLLAPSLALPLSIFVDRGPTDEARISPHLFPIALWIFDDFAWTCARNSVIFAVVVSLSSLVGGAFLGWVIGRRRCWGRWLLHPLIVAMAAVPPAFVALGLLGVLGGPRPWPWPFSIVNGGIAGVSLESWESLPLWIVWIWATLPCGVAIVTFASTAAVEQLRPSWEDSARLVGVSSFKIWKTLTWPFVRPSSARAAALVFVMSLVEPGRAFDSRAAPHARISSRADRPSHRSVSFGCRLGGHDGSVRTRGLGHLAMVGRQPDQ